VKHPGVLTTITLLCHRKQFSSEVTYEEIYVNFIVMIWKNYFNSVVVDNFHAKFLRLQFFTNVFYD